MIDPERVIANTLVRHIEWHDEIASTNTRALELAADLSVATPLLIGATSQSAGRGRGPNRWWGTVGTLMFSVLFDMRDLGLPQSDWPRFSLGTGLSVAETIETFLPTADVGLKWPNDVWLAGRKVCGILIEQSDRSPGRVVVGIGLNINTQFSDAPADIRSVATSMLMESEIPFDDEEILIQLLRRWEINIAAQRTSNWPISRLWSRLCVLTGRNVCVTSANGEIRGECQGIADDGALLVSAQNRLQRCFAGTVRPI